MVDAPGPQVRLNCFMDAIRALFKRFQINFLESAAFRLVPNIVDIVRAEFWHIFDFGLLLDVFALLPRLSAALLVDHVYLHNLCGSAFGSTAAFGASR